MVNGYGEIEACYRVTVHRVDCDYYVEGEYQDAPATCTGTIRIWVRTASRIVNTKAFSVFCR